MNNYKIRQIHHDEYKIIRKLDRDAFEYNERGSDGYWHELYAENIRHSPYYIPELELVAVKNDGTYYGHAVFSALPMGDNGEHIIWLNILAVKHGDKDDHVEKSYEYQRKGIGTALVMRGLEIAKTIGYAGCMTCGHPDVYKKKMGFSGCVDFGIAVDESVVDGSDYVYAIELVPGGFNKTNKLLSYSYYDFARNEMLIQALCKMLGKSIINADYKSKQLHGGTVGEVRLVSGIAETADGEKLPYKVVLKIQKKWERHRDPGSWRREYDLYKSDFGTLFTDSLRWPECYHAEMNEEETETQLWLEYIEGVSGLDLTADMYERAALELGRFQGRLYAEQPVALRNLTNLSDVEFSKNSYLHYRSWEKVYDYIRSSDCEIPKHLCQMLIDIDDNSDAVWERIEKLPVVMCHRDFWVTNIFYKGDKILLIDWDTTGWGYLGEDIASLIADEADVPNMVEYYKRCVSAYYKGFSEYVDTSNITDNWLVGAESRNKTICAFQNAPARHASSVYELILVMFGYRLVEWYLNADSLEVKALQIDTLQKIYEMKGA